MLRGIRLMRQHPPEFLRQCEQRHGSVVSFPIPRRTVVFLADPVDVRRVLQQNHVGYGKRTIQYDALATVTGIGLLASDGQLWRRLRRLEQPAFHANLIDGMVQQILDPADRLVERWQRRPSSNVVDVEQEMLQLTLEIVGGTLFGSDLHDRATELVNEVASALRVAVARSQRPLRSPSWLPTSSTRTLRRSLARLDDAVTQLLAIRRRNPAGDDVLWLLITAHDEGLITAEELRNEIVTLIVAGHETVAATLTWTWYLLATAPAVLAQLRREVDLLPQGNWTAEVLPRLPLTRAVIDECLRLFPPAWVISRKSLAPDVLGGYDIPAGATIITSPYLLQRDPRWWPRPDSFDPSRFLDGATAPADRDAYLPFGTGPRLCIGRELAVMEATLVVARLARSVEITPTSATEPDLDFGVTLRPRRGLPVTVSGRLDGQT